MESLEASELKIENEISKGKDPSLSTAKIKNETTITEREVDKSKDPIELKERKEEDINFAKELKELFDGSEVSEDGMDYLI